MFAFASSKTVTPRAALRRLTLLYFGALGVLLASIAATVVVANLTATRLQATAERAGLAGQQAMLSELIVSLATLHHRAATDGMDGLARAGDSPAPQLEARIAQFAQAQTALVGNRPREQETQGESAAFHDRAEAFVTAARQVLAAPGDRQALATLEGHSADGLQAGYARIAAAAEADADDRLYIIQHIEIAALVITIGVILVELFIIFLPGYRLLHRMFAASAARSRQLRDAQTELGLSNQALRRKNTEMEKEKERLRTALENAALLCGEQAAFTYSVSHDLKSPANTLQLLLDELIHEHAGALDGDGLTLLNLAQESITHMSILIEDVLQYSWATDPHEAPDKITLRDSVERVMASLADQIDRTGATITLGPMQTLTAAPKQIDMLMLELISNGLKFQPTDQKPALHITSSRGDTPETTIIEVRDNGIGIAADDQQRIFGLFQRLHLRDHYPGSGLGLATCQRIVANHSGHITVRSAPGEGSLFEVTLGAMLSVDEPLTSKRAARRNMLIGMGNHAACAKRQRPLPFLTGPEKRAAIAPYR
ncbi:sensor histidine kinase [Sulfitobacter sp. JB4-11]|uniref:sensor histidine kinase n=1 Tax=Sulfitobacter rhodophyticola TaxID=3238304 RepID=UPI003D8170AE